jgi:hypothetical protein
MTFSPDFAKAVRDLGWSTGRDRGVRGGHDRKMESRFQPFINEKKVARLNQSLYRLVKLASLSYLGCSR